MRQLRPSWSITKISRTFIVWWYSRGALEQSRPSGVCTVPSQPTTVCGLPSSLQRPMGSCHVKCPLSVCFKAIWSYSKVFMWVSSAVQNPMGVCLELDVPQREWTMSDGFSPALEQWFVCASSVTVSPAAATATKRSKPFRNFFPPSTSWHHPLCNCTVIQSSWEPEKAERRRAGMGGSYFSVWSIPCTKHLHKQNRGLGLGTGTNSVGTQGTQCPYQLKLGLITCVSKDTLRALDVQVIET